MKILHVTPSYIPAWRYGGPIRSVHGLCKGLAALGHEVHVYTTNVDGPGDSDVPLGVPVMMDGVNVWYFPSQRLRRLFRAPAMDRALAENVHDFDLVHLHSIYLWPTWAAARAARRNNVPYLISPRGMLVKELIRRKSRFIKTAWITFIERRNLECAAAIHATSELEAAEARSFGFRLPEVFVVPNGVDCVPDESHRDTLSTAVREVLARGRYILFIGRLNWKKGLDRLIAALPEVPGVCLAIAGNDEENYRPLLDRLANEHHVSDRILFTGPVLGADKSALFRNAEVFVLSSYSENFGNVILEAMAEGCPVVVTPEVGAAEIVKEAGAGIVVDGEPKNLGRALANLLAKHSDAKQMGMRGKMAVAEKYSWHEIAKNMLEKYAKIIGKNGSTGQRG